ncbi:MAG TPA: hypothetical protein VG944_22345 [Fimbriimonas sp.]|nr:hypothetical protein [Fimbriimonas sp.]
MASKWAGWLLLLAGTCVRAAAQTGFTREQVLAPPQPIAFGEWQKTAEPLGGIEYLERFPSAVTTPYRENNTVPLMVFVPENRDKPAPVVLITHYWGATDLKAETSLATDLNARGLAAAIVTLPYHLTRTPPGFRSGQLAIQPDPARLQEMMVQSEQDVRRSLDFLDSRPEFIHGSYGLVGTSLGAVVSGLVFAIDSRIQYSAFVLGGADLAHILWNSSRVIAQRDAMRRAGWTEAKVRTALAAVEPLNYLPRTDPGTVLMISGKYDTVVPRECTRELLAKLPGAQRVEIDTGHYGGIFVEKKVLRTVADFLSSTMNGHKYTAPKQLEAPTVRIGGLLSTPQGADIAIGIDFIHLDREGKGFGSFFATPRGIRLYLGREIAQGLSIGFVGSGQGVGVGLAWSVVL